jgi:hypothetical protein
MGKAKVRTFLIICAAIFSAPTWAGAFVVSDSGNVRQNWEWFDALLRFTWHGVPILVAMTMLYVLISFLPLDLKGKSAEFWLALAWLVMATLSLIGVVVIYLMAYKCDMNLAVYLQTAPPVWTSVWAVLITLMMVTISIGASLGKEDSKLVRSKSWNSLFVLIGGFITIWTCILSTFGLTVWSILPACPN